MQDGIARPAALRLAGTDGSRRAKKKSCGNDGALESLEIQRQDFHPSQRSLEISQRRRAFPHSHSSGCFSMGTEKTWGKGRSVGYGKVEIQSRDSHFPTAPAACGARYKIIKTKPLRGQKGSDRRCRARVSFHAHAALETNLGFMLNLRLENALAQVRHGAVGFSFFEAPSENKLSACNSGF
jgi:hypothetical protein